MTLSTFLALLREQQEARPRKWRLTENGRIRDIRDNCEGLWSMSICPLVSVAIYCFGRTEELGLSCIDAADIISAADYPLVTPLRRELLHICGLQED